jgi:hypothetical protein
MVAISGARPKVVLTSGRIKQIREEIAFLERRINELLNPKNKDASGKLITNVTGLPQQNVNVLKKQLEAKKKLLDDNVEKRTISDEQKNKLYARFEWLKGKIKGSISSIQEDETMPKDTRGMIKAVAHAKWEMTNREYQSWTQEYKRIATILEPDNPNLSNLILLKPDKRV